VVIPPTSAVFVQHRKFQLLLVLRNQLNQMCKMDEITWLAVVFGWRGTERICLQIEAVAPDCLAAER
jgi:hypothetical protein